MKIKTSELAATAVRADQYPAADMPEIAFAGRSNVGKSSLFNLLVNRKNLARISSSPGKTRTINFFEVNGKFRLVDLPGYGYAKAAKFVTTGWGRMIEHYLENRPNLLKVVQLVDIRHEPGRQDIQMYEYLKYYGLDGLAAATKSDKVSRNEMAANVKNIRRILGMKQDDIVIPVSSLKKTGRDELLDVIEKLTESAETPEE